MNDEKMSVDRIGSVADGKRNLATRLQESTQRDFKGSTESAVNRVLKFADVRELPEAAGARARLVQRNGDEELVT